jgi:hypothetical protein
MSNEGRYWQRLSTFAANWRVLALRGLAASYASSGVSSLTESGLTPSSAL